MTQQAPPAENNNHISPSSTSHEPEYLTSRPTSNITLFPAVSPMASTYRTTASSSPMHHATPDFGIVRSLDGNAAGAPQLPEPNNSGRKPSQKSTYAGQSSTHKAKRTILRSWWREIVATIFSITSMGLVLLLVLKINNTALGSWNFHVGSIAIQPNTLISVLTTIGQTLMMVPVTACIGQLKWRYFRRARHLHHMQLMDDASRGPWGSLLLLFHLASTKAATASLLSLVTIVALGIGPSAQQILEFRPAQVLLKNATAEIGLATNYSSKSYVSGFGGGRAYFTTSYNSDIFKLQSSVIDGIAGSVFAPNFVCPGDTCTWPDFTSLGFCGSYYNLTDSIEADCTGDSFLLNCTYEVPQALTSVGASETVTVIFSDQTSPMCPPTTIFQSNSFGMFYEPDSVGIFAVKVPNANERPTYKPPATEVSFSKWNWCAKTYKNVTASPAGITGGTVESEKLAPIGFLSDVREDSGMHIYTTQSGLEFYVDSNSQLQLFDWLGSLLERSIQDYYPHAGTQRDKDSFNLGFFLYASDLNVVTQDLANTLTNQIRSAGPGDNLNATRLTGQAYVTQTYIFIRWQWIIVPLADGAYMWLIGTLHFHHSL